MEEINQAVEAQEPDVEALWDGEDTDGRAEDQRPEEPTEAGEAPVEEEQQEQTEPSEGEQTSPASQQQTSGEAAQELFKLTYMQEQREVTREEMIALAQQGMDYERVRTKYDELQAYRREADPVLTMVRGYAERSGMTLEQYLDHCRTQELMAQGVNEPTAKALVAAEKGRTSPPQEERPREEAHPQESAPDRGGEARNRDFDAFLTAYPDVKAADIPKEVWARVAKGESLVTAYTMHQNQLLRGQLAAQEQNRQNAARAPGSMSTQGEKGRKTIDDLWDEAGD